MFRNLFVEINNNFSILTDCYCKTLSTNYLVGNRYIVFKQNMMIFLCENYLKINF